MKDIYKRFGKRLLDVIFSVIFIFLLSPIFILVSLVILITLGRPIIFKQERPGYKSKLFTIYKFRSMHDHKDEKGIPLSNKDRVTWFGNFIRKTSIDELPELLNVLKGDMSIVGPRPLLKDYLEIYTDEQNRRHDVRGGITGLAQINGRNLISFEKRFEFDLYYVDNISFKLDVRILLRTIVNVLKIRNINLDERAHRKTFESNNQNNL